MRTIKFSLTNIMKLVDISTRMITTAFILFTLYRFSDFNSVSSFAEAFENINSHLMNLGTSKSVVPIQNEVVLSSESITSLEVKDDQLALDEGDKLTSSEEKKGKGRFYKVMLVTGVVLFVGICLIGGGYYLFKTGGDVNSLGGSAEDVAEATTSLAELAEDIGGSVEDLGVVKTSLTGLADEIVESTTSLGDATENAAICLGESSGDIVEVTKALNSIAEVNNNSSRILYSSVTTLDEAARKIFDLGDSVGGMTETLDKSAKTFMVTAQELSSKMEEANCSKYLEGSWLDPYSVGADGADPSSVGAKGADPSSVGAKGADPSSVGAKGADPSSVGAKGADPSSVGAKGADPSSVGAKGADSSSVGAKGASKTSTSSLDLSRGVSGGGKTRVVKSNLRTNKHKKGK